MRSKRRAPFRRRAPLLLLSQNCRGLKTDARLTELCATLNGRRAFITGLQETWRTGKEDLRQDGLRFLGVGPEQQTGRGSLGLGIFSSALWRSAHGSVRVATFMWTTLRGA